ncbi:septum formation initiator family protein [bacterium]|nr:MAG: septum formation initiator family protein [bacterium]
MSILPRENVTKNLLDDTASIEKKKKRKKVLFWSVISVIAMTIIFGNYGAYQMVVIKRQKMNLENEIAQLKKDQAHLLKNRERIKNDLTYIEKVAREKYSMVKPGEHVYQVIPKNKETKK